MFENNKYNDNLYEPSKINTTIIDTIDDIENNEIINVEIEDNKMPIIPQIQQTSQTPQIQQPPQIPQIQQKNVKSSCVLPNKDMAKCIADTIIKTNCVKCSLENCDKNHTLSTSCYENEKHSHNNFKDDMNNNILDYYSTNNLHEYNSIDNLNQENTHIIYKGMYGNSIY
jgi:hypothetical protein